MKERLLNSLPFLLTSELPKSFVTFPGLSEARELANGIVCSIIDIRPRSNVELHMRQTKLSELSSTSDSTEFDRLNLDGSICSIRLLRTVDLRYSRESNLKICMIMYILGPRDSFSMR